VEAVRKSTKHQACHPDGEGTETCFGLRLKDLVLYVFKI
jgi:hypothetical protein